MSRHVDSNKWLIAAYARHSFASLHRPPDAAHWMAEVSPIARQRRLDVFCFVCVRGHNSPRSSGEIAGPKATCRNSYQGLDLGTRRRHRSGLFCFFVYESLEFVTFLSETSIINVEIFRKAEEFAVANVVGDFQVSFCHCRKTLRSRAWPAKRQSGGTTLKSPHSQSPTER